jgi:hypothetical protein
MASLSSKKQVTSGRPRRAPALGIDDKAVEPFHILDSKGRHVGGVAKAKSLGNGYVLVKFSTGHELARESTPGKAKKSIIATEMKSPRSMTDLPEIPDSQVKRVLEKYGSNKTAKAVYSLAENKRIMEEMRTQERLNRAQEVLSGALLKPGEFLEARGITRQSLSKAVKDKRIFFIPGESGLRFYPAFFADPKSDRAGLEKVSKELGDLPGTSKWQFFTTKKLSLGSLTPVEAIRKGQIQKVLASAAGFREQ